MGPSPRALLRAVAVLVLVAGVGGRPFTRLDYGDIATRLEALAAAYPTFATLTTAQEAFGVASPGLCGDAPCKHYILRLSSYPEATQPPLLPEAFVSGALHGDERVGPVTALEVAELLVLGASCATYRGEACGRLADFQLGPADLAWLKRLLDSRAVYIMPMTNAHGYASEAAAPVRGVRTDVWLGDDGQPRVKSDGRLEGIDANRDFPFDYALGQPCMRSPTARAVNEIFRAHAFQLSVTFHAGQEVIAYEWGSENNHNIPNDVSPDDAAQVQLSAGESRYAGSFEDTVAYEIGRMSRTVYAVSGGMEDWAYAGSWDEPQRACADQTDYPAARSASYENVTLRCINFLVETSRNKDPEELGATEGVLAPQSAANNGHVARNLRLALQHLDVLRPVVLAIPRLAQKPERRLGEEAAFPLQVANGMCSVLARPADAAEYLGFAVSVWGAFTVDDLEVFAAAWPTSPDGGNLVCKSTAEDAEALWHDAALLYSAPVAGAVARWGSAANDSDDLPSTNLTVHLPSLTPLFDSAGPLLVGVRTRVDGAWKAPPADAQPTGLPPQSHLVNARTNPAWDMATSDQKHRVTGREWFYTEPMLVSRDAANGTFVILNPCSDTVSTGVLTLAALATRQASNYTDDFVEQNCDVDEMDVTPAADAIELVEYIQARESSAPIVNETAIPSVVPTPSEAPGGEPIPAPNSATNTTNATDSSNATSVTATPSIAPMAALPVASQSPSIAATLFPSAVPVEKHEQALPWAAMWGMLAILAMPYVYLCYRRTVQRDTPRTLLNAMYSKGFGQEAKYAPVSDVGGDIELESESASGSRKQSAYEYEPYEGDAYEEQDV